MQKTEIVLLEYDPEVTGAAIIGASQLFDVPWQKLVSAVSSLKIKDILVLGVGVWVLKKCLFPKRRQRISGQEKWGKQSSHHSLYCCYAG